MSANLHCVKFKKAEDKMNKFLWEVIYWINCIALNELTINVSKAVYMAFDLPK